MSALGCDDVAAHLESYRRGDAARELAVLIDDHLAHCPECRRHLAHLRQVSAMLSAWRPTAAPAELKVEIAEAASAALGESARHLWPRRRRPSPRKAPPGRPMPRAQRVANILAAAALVFLAAAVLWRLWTMHFGPGETTPADRPAPQAAPPKTGKDTVQLVLVRCGSRENEVIKLVEELTDMSLAEAELFCSRTPATLWYRASRADAEEARKRLEALGAEAELRPIIRDGP